MLSKQDREFLSTPERVNIGSYHAWRSENASEFVVGINARPLVALIEAAFSGSGVYELMSIQRPGDLLHYLWVDLSGLDLDVIQYVEDLVNSRKPFPSKSPEKLASMSFTEFDGCFFWAGDDTYPFAVSWLRHRESAYWSEKLPPLLALTRKMQDELRGADDFLLKHEISLIDAQKHRRDFLASPERQAVLSNSVTAQTELPKDLFQLIGKLIKQDDVQSVSCPFDDFALWRELVAEQVRRAHKLGVPPQQALTLNGPDSGLSHVIAEDWGGEIHIPYEGVCEADLFILPKWFNLFPDRAMGSNGSLSKAVGGRMCHYVLSDRDYGELDAATRETCGGWHLYRSKLPYTQKNILSSA